MDDGKPRTSRIWCITRGSCTYLTTVRNTLLTAFIQWPYSYDACDVGTAPNQTLNGRPESALTTGPAEYNYELSYLPGQRLSRCTCDGESHPGPKHADGTYVGRSAPEIDIFEAQVSGSVGEVSQSGQWAVSHQRMFSIFHLTRYIPRSLLTPRISGTTIPTILSSQIPQYHVSTRIVAG